MDPRSYYTAYVGRVSMMALFLAVPVPPVAAQVEADPDQRYLLLATTRTGTMEDELNEAAALGFRVVSGAPTPGDELVVFLERADTSDRYEYRLLATTRTSTMQRELDEAAAEGFRFVRGTPLCKKRAIGGEEIVVVLERPPEADRRYSYRLLATDRTSTLQQEVSQSVRDGFVISGLVSCDEHIVIMEREVDPGG